jgi:hypothetical protein
VLAAPLTTRQQADTIEPQHQIKPWRKGKVAGLLEDWRQFWSSRVFPLSCRVGSRH